MNNISGNCNWNGEGKVSETIVEEKIDKKELEKLVKNVVSSHKKYKQHIEELYQKTQKKEYYDILISIRVLDKDINELN